MDILILLVLFLISVLAYLKFMQRPTDFPPGPLGIPILGNLLQLGEAPFLKFQNEWKKKYGPICGVYFGSYKTVAISDYRLIREAMNESGLAGRPDMEMWHVRSKDKQARGLIFTHGEENQEQRKLAIKSLREFGYGKKSFENLVTSEILKILENFEKTCGEPITVKGKFHVHTLNILWQIIAGRECEEDRATLSKIFSNATRIMEQNNPLKAVFMFLPWYSKHFPKLSGFFNTSTELEDIWNFLGKHIKEHKKEAEEEEKYHDYIGAFICEMKKASESENRSFHKEIGDKNMMTSLLDLFFAGTDTVSNTIHWTLLLLSVNPHIQEKFHEEIDRVIGCSRLPEASDEDNMIYTQALIQEILRYTSIAPMAIFHSATQDVRFHGFKIPKDAMVLMNFHGAHHDKVYWGDPEAIRPSRFLSPDGQTLVKHEAYFPFGLGKRNCVGETLAKKQLFLFLTSIIQKFRVSVDPNIVNPSLKPIVSFILLPPNHKLVFEKRM